MVLGPPTMTTWARGRRTRLTSDPRSAAGDVDHQVISRCALGEVLPGVVDHLVGTQRRHHVQVPAAAHSRDFGPQGFGDLDRERAYAACRPVHQDMLACVDRAFVPQSLKGGERGHRDRRSLLEREPGGLGSQRDVFADRYQLGKRARGGAVDLVPRQKTGDAVADSLDHAGEVGAQSLTGWLGQSESGSSDVRSPGEGEPVERVGRSSSNPDQDIGFTDLGLFDVARVRGHQAGHIGRKRSPAPEQGIATAPGRLRGSGVPTLPDRAA